MPQGDSEDRSGSDVNIGAQRITIVPGDLDDPRVRVLLAQHVTSARAATAPGSAHALDLEDLKGPEIMFWTAWEEQALLRVAALKVLSHDHGEVKSMHAAPAYRRRGVGRAMLVHIIDVARAMGMSRLSLETGSSGFFAPARRLYERHGFVECPPFGEYVPNPNSVFMRLDVC
jgi:putative acetyltransferase